MRPYVFDDNAYVVLDGDLDLFRKDELRESLPSPDTVKTCVINLSRAEYIDSLVLGMLVAFRREFVASGNPPDNLTIILPKSGSVRTAFERTGLTRLFSIATIEPSSVRAEEHLTKQPSRRAP